MTSITNKSIPISITSIALLSVCNGTDLTTFNRREARAAIIHRLVALQQVTVEGQRRELDIRGNPLVIDAGFRCGDGVVRYASSWRDHAGVAVQEVDVYMAGEYERLYRHSARPPLGITRTYPHETTADLPGVTHHFIDWALGLRRPGGTGWMDGDFVSSCQIETSPDNVILSTNIDDDSFAWTFGLVEGRLALEEYRSERGDGTVERLSASKFSRFDKWLLPGQVDYYLQESGATPIVHNSRTVISRYVLNDIDNTIENLRVSNTAGVRWHHQDNNDGFIGVGLRDSGLEPVVDRIVSEGPAAAAGIIVGDTILLINDKRVPDAFAGRQFISRGSDGTEYRIDLLRDDEIIETHLRLAALGDYLR